jgi:chloramphenicol 3-O phosphotransferase
MIIKETQYLPYGRVIVLNGPSSSGKTTLARGLMASLSDHHLHLSLDSFRNMEPEKYWEVDKEIMWRRVGALCRAINASVSTYSRHGQAIILDHVLSDEAWHYMLEDLTGLPVLIVGVVCPLEELTKREEMRSDRKNGLAKSQYKTIHADRDYDFVVDTSSLPANECVRVVHEWLKTSPATEAFQKMRAKFFAA